MYEDFGKIFKPITEHQKRSSEKIVSRFTPLQEAIENMPPALFWGQVEGQPEALPEPELDTPPIELDETSLAGEYLEKYSQIKGGADRAFGISRDKGKYFMGGKKVIIDRDSNLCVGEKNIRGNTRSLGGHCFEKKQKLIKFHKKIKINTWILLTQQMRSLLLINTEKKR